MARTENLTIMFTDVVGYTERTSAQSRGQIRDLLQRCKTILLPIVHRYGGWQVKNLGDALLIAFRSPTDALRCGMAQHDAVAASNRELPPEQHLHIRVAVALGEVLVQDRDVFGEAVNLAARLENVTPADRLYFTEAVYLAMNKAEVPSEVVGVEQFKGIPEPVKVYQVPPRQVARLIPAAEPLSTPEPELPFGGAHLLGAEVPLAARMRGRWQELLLHAGHAGQQVGLRARWLRADVAAAALLMLAAALWAWRLWPPAPSAADVPAAAEPAATASVTAAGASSLLAQAEPLLGGGGHDEGFTKRGCRRIRAMPRRCCCAVTICSGRTSAAPPSAAMPRRCRSSRRSIPIRAWREIWRRA
jgi:adenylate cyclase